MGLINAEIQRRSEEIDNAEVQYNKQWVVLKNQEKEIDKKRTDFGEIQKQNDIVLVKHEKLNHYLQDEEENLTMGHK